MPRAAAISALRSIELADWGRRVGLLLEQFLDLFPVPLILGLLPVPLDQELDQAGARRGYRLHQLATLRDRLVDLSCST